MVAGYVGTAMALRDVFRREYFDPRPGEHAVPESVGADRQRPDADGHGERRDSVAASEYRPDEANGDVHRASAGALPSGAAARWSRT